MALDVSTLHGMNSERKAAILLVSLAPEVSSKVMQYLSEDEIETLTLHIANITRISPEERDFVLENFYDRIAGGGGLQAGGIAFAKELLERALGPQKAQLILEKLSTSVQVAPLSFLREVDVNQLAALLQSEHPQTIAIILAHMPPRDAAEVLSTLPDEMAVDVSMRLALMDRTAPDVLHSIERVLEKNLAGAVIRSYEEEVSGGVKALAEILNNVDRSTEKSILEAFARKNPELAEEVKKLMFVFEDIVILDDRSIQKVLQDVETKELALALKGSTPEVREKILRNLSERAAEMLQEEIEYLGPVRLRQVEEAQQSIVAKIRVLEEAGEIIVARGGEDEIIE